MIQWGQKSKPKKIPGPKFNPLKKSHAEFPSHKNFQKAFKEQSQLMHMCIRYHFLADLYVTRHALEWNRKWVAYPEYSKQNLVELN